VGKFAAIALKLLLSGGLAWYAIVKIDLGSAWATLRAMDPGWLAVAVALLFLQFLLGGIRLRALLRALGTRYPLGSAVEAVLVGAFFSQTLISFVGGDAMRIWRIVRARVPMTTAVQSVLFDRVAGFAGLFVLLFLAAPFLARLVQGLEMLFGLALIVGAALGGIALAFILRRLPPALTRSRALSLAKGVVDTGLEIWRTRSGAVLVLGLSVAIQFANVVILYCLSMGLEVSVAFGDGFLLFPTVLFLSMLPISFAGWGVREGAMVAALSLVGIPAHQSLALSVSFGLCLVAVSLPGGALWLVSRHAPIEQAS